MSELIRIDIDDGELRALMDMMDDALRMKEALLTGVALEPTKMAAAASDVDKILANAGEVEAVLVAIDEAKDGLLDVGDELRDLKLPTVSRATRMLLLRVPGLREVLRLMYQIKMLQGQILTPGVAGKVVALLVSIIYISEAMNKRQRKIEARLDQLEQDRDLRDITMDEAVRRFGELPERYRSTVVP